MAQKQGKGRKFGRNTRSNSGKMQRIRTERNKAKARAAESAKGKPGDVQLQHVPTAKASHLIEVRNVAEWSAFAKKVRDDEGSVIGYVPGMLIRRAEYRIGYETLCFNGQKERVYYK